MDRAGGQAFAARVRQDRVLADALRQATHELGAFLSVVYLIDADAGDLVATAVGGEPPFVFTIPQRIPRDSPLVSAAVPRTGDPIGSALPILTGGEERALRLIPYPHSFVTAPLMGESRVIGILTALWSPPRPYDMPHLLNLMSHLAEQTVESLIDGRSSESMRPASGPAPTVIPLASGKTAASKAPRHGSGWPTWGVPELGGSPALTQMYQLHMLSEALNQASGIEEVMRAADDWIVRPFGGQTLVVAIADQGRLRVVGQRRATGLAKAIHRQHLDSAIPSANVLRTGQPLYLSDARTVSDLFPQADIGDLQAMAVLPVTAGDRVVGSCLLGFDHARVFETDEQVLLLMMTGNLAVALERERLSEAGRCLADALQRKLLPRSIPALSQVVTTARYLPPPASAGMGGDWYDVIPLPGKLVGLVVGDVQGHGVDSAVIMGQLRSGLRAYAAEGHDAATVMARSSELLAELEADIYATCCFVRFDPELETADIASAGHPAPLLRTPDGELILPPVPSNPPLAVISNHRYATTEIPVPAGSLLMLYTDGIAREPDGDPISAASELLQAMEGVERKSLEGLADEAVDQAARSARRDDDMVLLLALYEGGPLGPMPRGDQMWIARHDIGSVRAARRFVRGYLEQRHLAHLSDDLEVITSEAVTNALIHADSEVEVRLREYPDRVHLEVRDTDATPPVPTSVTQSDEANAVAEHGRGMGIMEWLSSAWGSSPNGRGKTVWVDVSK